MSDYLSNNLLGSNLAKSQLQQNALTKKTDDSDASIIDSGLDMESDVELSKEEVLEKIEQLKQQSPENIEEYDMLIEELNSGEIAVDTAYQQLVENNNSISVSDYDKDSLIKDTVIQILEIQLAGLETTFEETKSENGLIGKLWDGFKNLTGIGIGSSKVQNEIDDLKRQIEDCKNGKTDLATMYKNITGEDATEDNLNKLFYAESRLSDMSSVGKKVSGYSEGQKMCVDTVADIVSGIVSVGAVAFGSAVGICAAPFTAGASLGMIAGGLGIAAGIGSIVKTGIKAADSAVGGREYNLKNIAYDSITGAANGAMGVFSNGLAGSVGKAVMKAAGMEALETTVVKSAAITGTKAVVEETAKNVTLSTGKQIAAKTAAFTVGATIDGGLSGAMDSFSRDVATNLTNNSYDEDKNIIEILQDTAAGTLGGAVGGIVIGGAMKGAGKLGTLAGETDVGQKVGKNIKNVLGSVSDTLSDRMDTLAENIYIVDSARRTLSDFGTEINNELIKTSLKNSVTQIDDNIYSVRVGNYSVQIARDELSQKAINAMNLGNNTLIYNKAQSILAEALGESIQDGSIKEVSEAVSRNVDEKPIKNEVHDMTNGMDADEFGYHDSTPALNEVQTERYSNLTRMGFGDEIAEHIAQYNEKEYSRFLEIVDAGGGLDYLDEIVKLDETQYQKALKLLDLGVDSTYIANFSKLDEIQYQKVVELTNLAVEGENISDIIQLDETQYAKAIEILNKGINASYIGDILQLDDTQGQRAIQLIKQGLNCNESLLLAKLDDAQFSKAAELLNKGVSGGNALGFAKLDEAQYQKVVDLLNKGMKDTEISNIIKLDEVGYQRVSDLIDKGVEVDKTTEVAKLDNHKYQRMQDAIKNGVEVKDAVKMANLSDAEHERMLDLMEKGVRYERAYPFLDLNEAQYQKAVTLLQMNVDTDYLDKIISLDESKYNKAIEIFSKVPTDAEIEDILQPLKGREGELKVLELQNRVPNAADILEIVEFDGIHYQRATEMLDMGVHSYYAKQFAQLDDAQYEKAIELIKKGADSDDVFEELIGFSDMDED